MKQIFLTCILMMLSNGGGFAESSIADIQKDFLKTAKKYEQKSELAALTGNEHDAAIYKQLAEMKRDAAKVQGNYDWTEYHRLLKQLNHGNVGVNGQANKVKKSSASFDGAAQKYDQLAANAIASGNAEHAAIYKRMAEIKREAAKSGGDYDWSEYHELEGKLK